MIKLIVSDLDGTLLDREKKVQERERAALHRAAEQGIRLCLASGRLREEMEHVAGRIGLKPYVISINGAYVFGEGGRLLHKAGFERKLASEVLAAADGFKVGVLACTGEVNLTPEANEIVAHVNRRLLKPMTLRPDLADAIRDGRVGLCKFSFFGAMDELKRLQALVEKRLGGRVTTYVTDADCLDVMPFGVTKGDGLKKLLLHLGLRGDETLCIGDSFNDVSMFEVTPHSFAMAGSDPLVRAAARYEAARVADAVEWALRQSGEVRR
jgi:Cof subfamily protein (haloacid dehalogenase superfamily)